MLLATTLTFVDFAIIGGIILVLAGGGAVAGLRPSDRRRMRRIEDKLDLVLKHQGIEYASPKPGQWQTLADDPDQKIAAIKAYREEFGVSLAEAKQAVEDYIAGRGQG
jgi:hypothetical protein